jgi:hypothetical protein
MKFKLFTITAILISGICFAGEQLIGEWLINEGSGNTAFCSPGSYMMTDAILNGGENWTTDENGTWFRFAGTQTFQASYDVFPIDFSKDFRVTFDFWTGGNGGLFSNDTIGWGGGAWNIIKQDGYIVMQQHSGGVATGSIYIGDCDKDGDGVIGDDWYSVEVSYDADTNQAGMSIDGVEDTGVHYYQGGTGINLSSNPDRTNLVLGYHSVGYQLLNGGLRNVRIYQTLEKPTSPSPYNGQAAVVPGSLNLSWDDSYEGYSAGYSVYISTVEDEITNRSVTPVAAATNSAEVTVDGDSVYYWAVDGDGIIGDTWSFQTQGVKPYGLLPANNSTGISTFATLSWTEDSEVDSFNVYISDDIGDLDSVTPVSTTETSLSFAANALELHRWYYWKVAAVIGEQEFDSAVSSFQTTGDEWLDRFDYGSNDAIRAAWVQQAGSGYDIAWLSRPNAPYNNPAFANIPYGPDGASSFIKTFESPLDFSKAANMTLSIFHEADGLVNCAPLTVTLLDEQGGTIISSTYTPGDILSDDGQFDVKVWYRWIVPFAADTAGLDAVAAVELTVPQFEPGRWLFVDTLTITVPQCEGGGIAGDAYGDCQIDLKDFAVIAGNWLGCNRIPADSCDDYFYEIFAEIE